MGIRLLLMQKQYSGALRVARKGKRKALVRYVAMFQAMKKNPNPKPTQKKLQKLTFSRYSGSRNR